VTVLVVTNNCGLYRLKNLESEPTGELVHDFRGNGCALPVIIDNYWIQSVPPHSLVTLDISQPAHPKEVSRFELADDELPHWMAREPKGRRVVLTGAGALRGRVLIFRVGPDGSLRMEPVPVAAGNGKPGIFLGAGPHGVVFSLP
jgi:hypothetical protein